MNTTPPDDETNAEAKSMNDQLRRDVASWSAARPATSTAPAAEPSIAAPKQPAPKAKRPKPAAPDPQPPQARTKPFSMSYGGVTNAEHIAIMIARGAR